MRIVSARISGFRNLAEDAFAFSPRVNLLLGRNGEGKTNLLEALNWLALGRSHRGSRNEDLIAFGRDDLHVGLELEEDQGGLVSCEFGLDRSGGRRLRIDGELVKRRTDLVGRLATVFFNPDSIRLVQGGPEGRRQFADQGMAEIDPAYLGHLAALQRALKQKAGLLRDIKRGVVSGARGRQELAAWNAEIAGHAAPVCRGRADYAALVTPFADRIHRELAGAAEPLVLTYRPRLESARRILSAGGAGEAEKHSENKGFEQDISAELDYIVGLEMQRGRPLTGPQLDDFEVRLGGPDGLDLRTFGSQGETRSAAIALILARSDALDSRRGVRPVLFLDDIFSELDRDRTRRLQEMASHLHQVFIATARPGDVADWRPADRRAWTVEAGRFSEIHGDPDPA
ncbi:MAG TPA: DNA replication and repair protein RecF [Candidatus Krumholzibacteria bacterium]|nr:DNA replication and repair protein RecF [Candidatus Krumholzibacteria bacterium]